MSRVLYGSLDLTNNQLLNVLLQVLASDPSPTEAKIYYNSTSKSVKYYNGTAWVTLGAGGSGAPSGAAGGDLAGTYPNPTIKPLVIDNADISATAAIATSKISGLGTRNAANGYAGLDASGLLSTSQLPLVAIDEVYTVSSQPAMLALTAQRGDMAIRTDTGRTFVLSTDVPSVLANWKEVLAAGAVASVNGNTGVVVLTLSSLGGVPTSRSVIAGSGLTGGGTLAGDVTLDVIGDANLSVAADMINVLSAPKWTTPRLLKLAGDLSGQVTIDGSSAMTLTASVLSGGGGTDDGDQRGVAWWVGVGPPGYLPEALPDDLYLDESSGNIYLLSSGAVAGATGFGEAPYGSGPYGGI